MRTMSQENQQTTGSPVPTSKSPKTADQSSYLPRLDSNTTNTMSNKLRNKAQFLNTAYAKTRNLKSENTSKHRSQINRNSLMPRTNSQGFINQAESLHKDRTIHYKEGKSLGGTNFYIIEISRHEGKLCIAAFDTQSPETLMI